MSRDRDEALADIYRRGRRLRWRSRARVLSVAVVALAVTAGLVAAGHPGGTAHRTVLADGHSPHTQLQAGQTTSAGPSGTSSDDDSSSTPTTTRHHGSKSNGHSTDGSSTTVDAHDGLAGGTTSTTLDCHNSTNPDCGPFHYDPPLPANRPPHITIASSPATPVVGQPVTFTVTVEDPDGQGPGRCGTFNPDVDNQESTTTTVTPKAASTCLSTASADPAATNGYGAWDPPTTVPGHQETHYTVTYDKPGSHTVSYSTFDVGQCGGKSCPTADKQMTVDVDPPPTTTVKSSAKRS